jgi:hypothetical protein
MVPAAGLEPMWKVSKARVYAALRRPTPALIGTNWYDLEVGETGVNKIKRKICNFPTNGISRLWP